jgi:hypothetical protein
MDGEGVGGQAHRPPATPRLGAGRLVSSVLFPKCPLGRAARLPFARPYCGQSNRAPPMAGMGIVSIVFSHGKPQLSTRTLFQTRSVSQILLLLGGANTSFVQYLLLMIVPTTS